MKRKITPKEMYKVCKLCQLQYEYNNKRETTFPEKRDSWTKTEETAETMARNLLGTVFMNFIPGNWFE